MRRAHGIGTNQLRRVAADRELVGVVGATLAEEPGDAQKKASFPREFVGERSVDRQAWIRYFLVVERQFRQPVGPEPAPGGFVERQARIEAARRRDSFETQGFSGLGFERIIV